VNTHTRSSLVAVGARDAGTGEARRARSRATASAPSRADAGALRAGQRVDPPRELAAAEPQRRCRRVATRHREQEPRVRRGVEGTVGQRVGVARLLAGQVELAVDPVHHRPEEPGAGDHALHDADGAVAATDVGQLVRERGAEPRPIVGEGRRHHHDRAQHADHVGAGRDAEAHVDGGARADPRCQRRDLVDQPRRAPGRTPPRADGRDGSDAPPARRGSPCDRQPRQAERQGDRVPLGRRRDRRDRRRAPGRREREDHRGLGRAVARS
jgi:hypothetical protein